jgi:type I restriction-modification system DNA methylase subunit
MAYYGIPTKAIHEQWLGLVQPVGLVVAPAVLTKLELVPEQRTARLSALQLELTGLLDEAEGVNDQPVKVVSSFRQLATELLDWGDSDLVEASALETVPEVVLSEYGETLRPTHGVLKLEGEGLQALVLDLSQWRDASGTLTPQWDRDLDAAWNPTGSGWDATPQQRFERLLKETEHPIGLLFNGTQLRLVHAPRGESSGHITMPLEPMAEVAGRPMLGALELLLGVDRLFGGNPEQRLPALLAASRKNQNEVSTRLAEQVLEALWELLLGFDSAEQLAQQSGRTVLGALPTTEKGQKHLYGGLISVLLRLVFLLYAEDEELMPRDSLYGQHYSVSALADRLRQERFEHQSGMAERRGGWASLLSLFRLVYDGGGADPNYLPARHGEMFDPDAYPFLEGRDADSAYDDGILDNLPALSDDVVEKVLSKLIWLDGERLSYRALDVEQIGSVYEGIMGFTVEQAQGPSVGITYRPSRQKITITVVVDAEQLLAQPAGKREKWLDDQTGVTLKLPAKVKKDLKEATSLAELCVALDKKLSSHTPNSLPAGSLILQPTAERRRSGSHYTPRALTEPIVAEAFRPWLERCNHKPTAEQILALKVCDPAMGSGAFLVAVCRFVAEWLVEAWERDGYPGDFRQEWDKDIVARRRIAQSCLYGVDKNPFAVNLARLSLWLVTLSKELPFTFVDHALKCGDSLVGYSVKEIRAAMSEVQLGFLDAQNRIYEQMGIDRRESFAFDSLSDADYDSKKQRLDEQIKATEGLRQAGDLMVAAFFDAAKARDRAYKQQVYLAMLSGAFNDHALKDSIEEICIHLAYGDHGLTPFHWDLEFPEVFQYGRNGFDVFVGNPPFIGGKKIATFLGSDYQDYIKYFYEGPKGSADYVAFFFRRSFSLLSEGGSMSLLATNAISETSTRKFGIDVIVDHQGGCIYSANTNFPWPGEADVWVSRVSIYRGSFSGEKTLNGLRVAQIDCSLDSAIDAGSVKRLSHDILYAQGVTLQGSAFVLESDEAKDRLTTNPGLAKYLRVFVNGDVMNGCVEMDDGRRAVDFGELELDQISGCNDILANIIEVVSHERKGQTKQVHETRPWLYWDKRTEFFKKARKLDRIIGCVKTSQYICFDFADPNCFFSQSLKLFADDRPGLLAILQSTINEYWTEVTTSTMGAALRYNTSTSFDTFPFPVSSTIESLEVAGESYWKVRRQAKQDLDCGLTSLYVQLNSPFCDLPSIRSLRDEHANINHQIVNAFGWQDIRLEHGFVLKKEPLLSILDDYPEINNYIENPNDLFAHDDGEINSIEMDMMGIGLSKKHIVWKFGWPPLIRQQVLSRLISLNAERYQEEADQGLHGGGRRGGGGNSGDSGTGRRRGRPPKTPPPDSGQTAQIGLAL